MLTNEQAAHELRRTNKIAAVLGIAFSAWGIALFPYGDAYAQAHVGTFLMMAMLCSMLCLIHLRSAALIVALTVGIPFAVFFAATGIPSFTATALNVTLVTVAVVIVIMIQYRDFTRMVASQKRTETLSNENLRLANIDSLTDLPNRRAFFSHLEAACAAATARGTRLALGVIDLDGFKPVNDLYGHPTGDRLLVEVARRLSSHDVFMARLGGDEFAYVVAEAAEDDALVARGEVLVAMLREPFVLSDVTAQISGSLGIAVFPDMAASPQQLFERADYRSITAKHEAWHDHPVLGGHMVQGYFYSAPLSAERATSYLDAQVKPAEDGAGSLPSGSRRAATG